MDNELTNLLPSERRAALSRNYFIRLGVVVVLIVTVLIVISMVLLVPTYVYLRDSASTKEAHLASIESVLSSTDEAGLSARINALTSNAATLSMLTQVRSPSMIIRSMLAISSPGIALTGFSYTPASGKNTGMLVINGMAETRDALRSYQIALQGASFAHAADLPVSAYAKDSNIQFTITVTLAP